MKLSDRNLFGNGIQFFKYLCYFFQFKDQQIRKFSNNIDFRKLDFLSEEIESTLRDVFVYKAGALTNFFLLKKSSFLKSMILLNFPIR